MTIFHSRRRTIFLGLIFGVFLLSLMLLGGRVYAQDGDPAHPTMSEPVGKAYRGKTLFEQRCVQCHGEQGKGDGSLAEQIPGPLPDFTASDYTTGKSPRDVFEVITNGRMDKMMPPWGGQLSEAERWDLTAYVWSLHLSPDDIAAAQQLYEQQCSSCHGSSGAGLQADVPSLVNVQWLGATDDQIIAAFTDANHPPIDAGDAAQQALLANAVRRFSLGFDQNQVTVEGVGDAEVVVQNGTTGEHLANQPVRLIIFEQEQYVETRDGVTDDQGRVQFTGLPTAPTWAYVAETTYQDLAYHSEIGAFSPDSNMIELSVSVYDPGASKDAVSIDRAHWLVDISNPSFIDVGEVYSFLNTADKVYAGETVPNADAPRVLTIPLPANAVHINVEGETLGERFLLEGTTLIDTQPLPPGNTQIFVRYSLPVEKGSATLAHEIAYPTKMLNLLAPDIGITIEAPDWQQDDPIQTQGGDFLNYSIFDLPAGATPSAIIANISADLLAPAAGNEPQQIIDSNAAPGVSGIPYLPWIVTGLGVVILAGGVFIGWRKHKQTLAALPELREEQKKALITQIAALDDAYEAGDIAADVYHKERNTLKLQLIALMRTEAEASEADEAPIAVSETPKIHPEETFEQVEDSHDGATD